MKIFKRILWIFLIRRHIEKIIKITTSERETFKDALKWGENNTSADEKYLESRIEMKNEVLAQLRNLL